MITEENVRVFLDGANRFFREVNKIDIEVGTPYLNENKNAIAYDYTGVITVVGPHEGIVYFTAPRVLLRHLLISIGEPDTSEAIMSDLTGEIANTISGNARSEFGEEFDISVPDVIHGVPGEAQLPRQLRSFIIPLRWKNYQAAVVVCLH